MLIKLLPKTNIALRRSLMQWLFGEINQSEFIKIAGGWKEGRNLIEIAKDSGYMLKNCKLYAYHYWYHGHAKPEFFQVERPDITVLKNLDLTFPYAVEPMSIAKFDRITGRLLTSNHMTTHINKLVYRKLIFLTSYGFGVDCLRGKMLEAGIYALMKQYPRFKSPLHFQNVAKTAIHNAAQTLITAQTRQKRQRLLRNEDGTFESLFVPLDTGAVTHVNKTLADGANDIVQENDRQSVMSHLENIVALSDSFSPKVKMFLSCMCGLRHSGFSEYIGQNNSEAIDSLQYESYRTKLEGYLGVTRDQTDALLLHLKDRI